MRPTLHFTPRSGWINDPHGITYRNGGYDVFYQFVPGRTEWTPDCHWGHARGGDLLSLAERDLAIAPGDGDDGIWTGCIVDAGSSSRAFYTAVSTPDFGVGRVRIARPVDDQWDRWDKGEVVVTAPSELDLVAFRDPFIAREDHGWRMYVGAAGRDGTAMALTWTSHDLDEWSYDGTALARSSSETSPVWTGALWECPQIFELDGSAVMVSSVWDDDVLHHVAYAVGSRDGGRFTPRAWGRLTWGDSFYAPSLFVDATGRSCLTFWMRGVGGDGWQGAHSIPYVLRLQGDRLVASPHPDVKAHRQRVADGATPALAADLVWARDSKEVVITSGGSVVAVLRRGSESVYIEAGGRVADLATTEEVRIILDGPIIEVSSDAGLWAGLIHPDGPGFEVSSDGGCDVHILV